MFLRTIALIGSLFLFSSSLFAQSGASNNGFIDYIDKKQEALSSGVVDFISDIDKTISGWINEPDEPLSCDALEKKLDNEFLQANESVDLFFKSEKYMDETQKGFLRIRLGSLFQTKESADFYYKIRAHIPLSRTKRDFQLYIDDVEQNYFDNGDLRQKETTKNEAGLRYFAPIYKDIKSHYSIGMSSFTGYARARYATDFTLGSWRIEPTQQFKYSLKSDWSEETNIYFDKTLEENSLFRTTLHRKTQSHVDGFDYALALSYYLTLSKTKGFSYTQQFWGNSKYSCDEHPEPYNGISNYSGFFSWRQNIFRKWIAYEVQPGVSFHRQYDYEPNYAVHFYVDFYFGKID
ncbi:MAG: hypothetical protein PHX44_05475 [Sulfurimonas sp.]|uniref:hypothetical protein n=1 Tax=Sulfurimonas sp. TaxID=2022749 RepID=UPI002605286C|nr:hypothetical protein [Sulfurimonas sp.]MDD2652480.1 hypothetical protein [Sulfurimonas sp.]MDD3452217.1 hypothetical protein [Sulfurimonas sp.]